MRHSRNQAEVDAALSALTSCSSSGVGNLLDLSIKAARARCTVGEMSDSMEKVKGRYVATSHMVSGAYLSEFGESDDLKVTLDAVKVRSDYIIYM